MIFNFNGLCLMSLLLDYKFFIFNSHIVISSSSVFRYILPLDIWLSLTNQNWNKLWIFHHEFALISGIKICLVKHMNAKIMWENYITAALSCVNITEVSPYNQLWQSSFKIWYIELEIQFHVNEILSVILICYS